MLVVPLLFKLSSLNILEILNSLIRNVPKHVYPCSADQVLARLIQLALWALRPGEFNAESQDSLKSPLQET